MEFVIIVIFVVFAVSISIIQVKSHRRKITERINSIGGKVIRIERKSVFAGPFLGVSRGKTVYRIEYKKGEEVKEGWVKFGDLYGPDWRL
jgi:hypothetical protein